MELIDLRVCLTKNTVLFIKMQISTSLEITYLPKMIVLFFKGQSYRYLQVCAMIRHREPKITEPTKLCDGLYYRFVRRLGIYMEPKITELQILTGLCHD
jgi:hypothetical protein